MSNTGQLAAFLEGLRGTRVEVRHAERGDKRRLQELAEKNAALALAHERAREERSRERRYGALTRLQEALRLPGMPVRIEGYDISNLGAENIVASMVVFEGGAPKKGDYRKFSITADGQNDVGAMREVLTRRFRRAEGAVEVERYDPSFEAVPDLVVVDGGKGQLGAAVDALTEAGLLEVVSLVSLAKREEEIFVPWSPEPIRLPVRRPGSASPAQGARRGPPLRPRVPPHETVGVDHPVAAGPTARRGGEAEEGHRSALRLAGKVSAGLPRRAGGRARTPGQGGERHLRVCPQDGLIK